MTTTVTVTMTFASVEEAITGLARLRSDDGAKVAPIQAAPTQLAKQPEGEPDPKPKAAGKKGDPEKAEYKVPSFKDASAPAAAATSHSAASKSNGAAPPESATSLDYATVGEAIKNGVASGKRPAVVEALAQFGAASGKDLKPEHYSAFMTALQTKLGAEESLS
jgi:hypothetical protein